MTGAIARIITDRGGLQVIVCRPPAEPSGPSPDIDWTHVCFIDNACNGHDTPGFRGRWLPQGTVSNKELYYRPLYQAGFIVAHGFLTLLSVIDHKDREHDVNAPSTPPSLACVPPDPRGAALPISYTHSVRSSFPHPGHALEGFFKRGKSDIHTALFRVCSTLPFRRLSTFQSRHTLGTSAACSCLPSQPPKLTYGNILVNCVSVSPSAPEKNYVDLFNFPQLWIDRSCQHTSCR